MIHPAAWWPTSPIWSAWRALAEGGSPTVRLDRWIDTAIDGLAEKEKR